MSTRGTRLWMLGKGVTALGAACGLLSFGDSRLFSRALVSVYPWGLARAPKNTRPQWLRAFPWTYELCAAKVYSRVSWCFQSLLGPQWTQFFLFSLIGFSQGRSTHALITPPHWWGNLAPIYTPSFSMFICLPGSSLNPHANIPLEPTSPNCSLFLFFSEELLNGNTFTKWNVYKYMLLFSNFLLITMKLSELSLFYPPQLFKKIKFFLPLKFSLKSSVVSVWLH